LNSCGDCAKAPKLNTSATVKVSNDLIEVYLAFSSRIIYVFKTTFMEASRQLLHIDNT